MKRLLSILGLLVVLGLAGALPARAYWPPVQEVYGPFVGQSGNDFIVNFHAVLPEGGDPAVGVWQTSDASEIMNTGNKDGLVYWQVKSKFTQQVKVCCAIYSPQHHDWYVYESEWHSNIFKWATAEGFYCWGVVQSLSYLFYITVFEPSDARWHEIAYIDPAIDVEMSNLIVKDNIIAVIYKDAQTNKNKMFYCMAYCPLVKSYFWDGKSDFGDLCLTINDQGTIEYYDATQPFLHYYFGFDAALTAWRDYTTPPNPYFEPQRASSTSKGVYFWDMSMGCSSRNWNFGDGQSSTARSPYHIYSNYSLYDATLTTCGKEYSQKVKTDFSPPTGSISLNQGTPYTNSTAVYVDFSNVTDNSGVVEWVRLCNIEGNDPPEWTAWFWMPSDKKYSWTLSPSPGYGLKTVEAQVRDGCGNVGQFSTNIFLETIPPTGSVTIQGGAAYAKSTAVTLTLFATDSDSGPDAMRFSNTTDFSAATWITPYADTAAWTLTAGDGTKTVYAQFRDQAGNVSTATISDSIILDATPPTASVAIQADAAYTQTTAVTLNLTASDGSGSGLDKMQFSNDNATWSALENFGSTKAWTLSSSDGTKTVYARVTDRVGNVRTVSDTIMLDATAPTGTIAIQSGAAYAKSTAVTLTLFATDSDSGPDAMRFSNTTDFTSATWITPYATTAAWTLPAGDGTKTVYAQFRDKAGNVSTETISDDITLDATAPTGTIAIQSGAAYTQTTAVTLNLTASDGSGSGLAQMQFSNDNTTWSTLENFANTKAWTLTSGDGTKTVYARFTDKAGNVSGAVSDNIILDATPPTGTIAIRGGAYTRILAVTLNLTSTGGATQMCFSANQTSWTAWENVAATKLYNLTAPDGVKWVYVKYRDAAGNESALLGASVTLDTVPPKDGKLQANPGNQQVTLKWSGFSDATSGLSTYRLLYGTTGVPAAATGTKIYEGAALTFTHKGLDNGQPCYYRLVAVDKAGNVSAGATAAATPRAGGALPFLDLLLDD